MEAREIIKSPGIPRYAPLIKKALEASIPVIGELEFASRFTSAKIIGITGSNGKTTTSLLTYHILKNAGLNVGLGGNIGKSFARQVAELDYEYYVLEISSFQLEDMFQFKAHIAILLNITPDHLDRYEYSLDKYARTKLRIIQNQTSQDAFIYCADDPETIKVLGNLVLPSRAYPFSQDPLIEASVPGKPSNSLEGKMASEMEPFAFLQKNQIIINSPINPFHMSIFDLSLEGKHNVYNTMAAGICAKILDLSNDTLRESMGNFKNTAHRLESVAKVQGIEFINDSKATNVNSVWYALETMHTPVIWIAGGVDKGNDYSMLRDLVRQKVKAIVCLGKDNHKIYEAFENEVEIMVNAFSAKEAVSLAYHLGQKGDTVLLSPACASFDLFKNYEDRGNQFKAAVKEL
jgi:UDP-N-acetylmuramoylalanine--D-glutamate ligase